MGNNQSKSISKEELFANNPILSIDEEILSNLSRISKIDELIQISKGKAIDTDEKSYSVETEKVAKYIIDKIKDVLNKNPEDFEKNSISHVVKKIGSELKENGDIEDYSIGIQIELISVKIKLIHTRYQRKKKNEELLVKNKELEEKNKELEKAIKEASTDSLTGLASRRIGDYQVESNVEKFHRSNNQFSVIMLDIDFFKNINDTFGHHIGDATLKGIAQILEKNIRSNIDTVARWGGEEFLIILDSANNKDAFHKAEIIRKDIEENLINFIKTSENKADFCQNKNSCTSNIHCKNNNLGCFAPKITCSFGVSTIRNIEGERESKEDLINRADEALYKAKENGRNQVCSLDKKEEQN